MENEWWGVNRVFRELLDEHYAFKKLHSDKSENTLRKLHKEYEEWMNRFYEVQ